MAISVGQPAPEFSLKDQSMQEVKLADYRGKKNVVMVFYPLDWSPVCTNEHACIVNDMKKFESLDAQVLGLSVDSAWSHKAYAEKMGIRYPLLGRFPAARRRSGKIRGLSARTRESPAAPSPLSTRRATLPGSSSTTFPWCRI